MGGRTPTAVVAAALAMTVGACGGGSDAEPTSRQATVGAPSGATSLDAARKRPRGAVENCSTRSEASFPGAFEDPRNVVVGPFALVGAAYTDPITVREFGGNKFPALVKAGHRVTVAVVGAARRVAALGYGPLPENVDLTPRDGHRVVTFIACDGPPPTFWSGFVLAGRPDCVPLHVWIDADPVPRRTVVRMGIRRCS